MFEDYKGYYAILGVQPSATAALIRAAYRVRAMELHPDRNADAEATAQTQKLNEAYEVLGNETTRAAYDRACRAQDAATATAEEAATTDATTGAAAEERSTGPTPVTCVRCGALTAQPRFREYITVTSWLVSSRKNTERGIYCSRCERRKAVTATGITAVVGWWSFYGFFWTLEALVKNLLVGWRFKSQDATLLYLQAMYFASVGKLDLAHAVGIEARDMASQARRLTAEQKKKVKLGYEVKDSLKEIHDAMSDLVQRTEALGQTLQLVRRPRVLQHAFMVQAGVIIAISFAVGAFAWRNELERREVEAARSKLEQERLVREGLERERARAIAQRQAEELRSLEQPLPMSGVLQRFLPRRYFDSPGGLPGLKITAPPELNYVVKLTNWDSGAPVMTIFVRAGEIAEASVPFGTYRIRMAAGKTWYGEKVRFGPDTRYTQVDTSADFRIEDDRLVGHELLLALVRNGNLKPSPINSDQF